MEEKYSFLCQYFGSKLILVVHLKIYIVKYTALTTWIEH